MFAPNQCARFLVLPWVIAMCLACPKEYELIEPVRVAVLNPRSGELGSLGPSWENAARLAAEQVNSSGGLFDGRPLELVFYDTESSPTTARNVVQQGIAEGAVAVVGPASSDESLRTKEVVQVPQISCCATSPELSEENDWFFRTTPNDFSQGKALAYLARNGRSDVSLSPCVEAAVVYRDDVYGQGLKQAFGDAYEGQSIAGSSQSGRIIADVPYDVGNVDANASAATAADLFRTAFDENHESRFRDVCIVLIGYPLDGAAVVSRLQAELSSINTVQNVVEAQFLGADGLYDSAFARVAGSDSAGMVGTAPVHAENDAYEKFRIAFHARFGSYPGNLTSNMYDAVMLMALAITQARDTGPESIRNALFDVSKTGRRFDGEFFGTMAEAILNGEDIDYVGPSGELDFDAAGDVVGDYTLWQPQLAEGGVYTIAETGYLPALEFDP